MTFTPRKINYLNNKDILKEIHKSKTSFCSFLKPEYNQYDLILTDVNEIKARVQDGINARADRLTKEAVDRYLELGTKVSASSVAVAPESIPLTDVIFRVMMWDHIPIAEAVAKKEKSGPIATELSDLFELSDPEPDEIDGVEAEMLEVIDKPPTKYVRTNFPPFQHFKLDENGDVVCVGKSHWKGDLVTGEFCKTHGQMTNNLAMMFMKLCDKYGTRSNWRGYSYVDEMKCQALLHLSHIGLQFNEGKSQNPFAYYTTALSNAFLKILSVEKRNQNIRDDILEMNSLNPSSTRMNSGSHHYDSDD
jgi:hypothetical protein